MWYDVIWCDVSVSVSVFCFPLLLISLSLVNWSSHTVVTTCLSRSILRLAHSHTRMDMGISCIIYQWCARSISRRWSRRIQITDKGNKTWSVKTSVQQVTKREAAKHLAAETEAKQAGMGWEMGMGMGMSMRTWCISHCACDFTSCHVMSCHVLCHVFCVDGCEYDVDVIRWLSRFSRSRHWLGTSWTSSSNMSTMSYIHGIYIAGKQMDMDG